MKQLARIMAESTSYPTISMEEELLAQAQAEDARVKAENAMDEAERVLDISECLEDLHFVVDRIKEVTPNEANLIQIVANTALAGTDASTETIVPSQEDASAGDTRSARLRAVIDRIVAAVRELIAKLWDNVQNFVASITKTLGNVQRRVDMAYKRFDEAEFKMDDRLGIQIPPIVQGDKILKDPRKILVGLRDYIKVVDEFIKDGNNRSHREGVYYSHLYTNFNGTADGAEESLRVLQELGRASKHSAATPNKSQSFSFDNVVTMTNYTSDSLIGGIVLSYNEFDVQRPVGENSNSPAIVAKIASSIFHSGYRIAADENRPEVSQSVQSDSFNKDEIRQLLGELRKMVELLQGSSMSLISSLEERTRWAKDTAKKIETAVASYQPEMNGVKAMAEASLRTMTFLSHQASTPYNSLISNTLKMINLVLVGVTRSLDAHEQVAEAT